MARPDLVDSFNYAIEGFMHVIKSQRNMRIHFLLAVLALLVGIYLNLSRIELLILCIAIAFVFLAEMFNTICELTLNLITEKPHPKVRLIKDISAGSVLVASINALVVGYMLFFKPMIISRFELALKNLRQSDWHVTFMALIIVVTCVLLSKLLLHRGTPLRGGMPSGHAAVSFSIWTIIALLTQNTLLVFLVFILALWIAQTRIRPGLHNIWEVAAGALTGIFITLMIFQILR